MPFMYPECLQTPDNPQPTANSQSAPDSSILYPKITNHVANTIKVLQDLQQRNDGFAPDTITESIPIIGSVKLHGTHADILVHADDTISFQSRNIVGLQTAKDNNGFVSVMSRKTRALLRLRDILLVRFRHLNPCTDVDTRQPVLIAGEWIGENIQKHVAVARLSKRFVIISIKINGQWQKDSDYGGIALPNHGIYNISRAGFFNMTLWPSDVERSMRELESLAEQIAKKCPFAATFAIEGEGEGIVWKPALPPYNSNPELWFKTKGGRFKPTFAPPPRQSPEAGEQNREAAANMAKMWCSEQRMIQGLEYLAELHIKQNMKGLSTFLKWVQNDVLVEEKAFIAEHRIDVASLKIEVAKISKPWYMAQLQR